MRSSPPGPPNPRDAVPGRGTPLPRGVRREWADDGTRKRRFNRLAVASLVLSILWLGWLGSILGVVLGWLAHRQIRRSLGWQRGDRLALAGTIVGVLGLALLALVVVQDRNHRATTSAPPASVVKSSTAKPVASAGTAPTPTSAQVSALASGFTQTGGKAGNSISYGVVLQNRSTTLTAVAVKVSETFLDSHGRSVATDSQTLTGIPAGSRFYVGGGTVSNVSLQVSKFEVAVKVSGSIATSQLLIPPATDVAFVKDDFLTKVVGSLRNPYKVQLPSDATIFLVYTNSAGRIVGGDSEPTGATIQPGATVSFSDNLISIRPSVGTTVEASVDPDGYPTPGSGHIQWTG